MIILRSFNPFLNLSVIQAKIDIMSSVKKSRDGLEDQNGPHYGTIDVKVGSQQDLLDLQDLDPAFNQKMRLVNDVRTSPNFKTRKKLTRTRLLTKLVGRRIT
jgi:hypothetical protein